MDPQSPSPPTTPLLDNALAALQRGDARQAHEGLAALLDGDVPMALAADRRLDALIADGSALEQLGEYAAAVARLVAADTEALAAGRTVQHLRAQLAMARVDHALGNAESAAQRLGAAGETAAALDDGALEGELQHLLGMTLSRLERDDEAERCLQRAIDRREACGEGAAAAASRNSLGVLHLHRGNRLPAGSAEARAAFDQARGHFEQAAEAARRQGEHHVEALAEGNIGTVAGSLGDFDAALARFELQLAAVRRLGDRQNESLVLANIGEAHRRAGRLAAGRAALDAALALGDAIGSPPRQRRAHAELSAVAEAAGDLAAALHHFKRYHELDRAIRSDEAARRATLVQARLAVDQVRREAEAYRHERDRLRGDNERLAQEAFTDAQTGLGNRRRFDAVMAAAWAPAATGQGALALLDLDHFKRINDAHGHGVGDRVLAEVGRLLSGALRPADQAFRLGGEEFGLWLPGTAADAARSVCERLRQHIAAFDWPALSPGLRVTASIGVALAAPGETVAHLVERADAALYAAKHGGRDRVHAG